MVGSCDNYMRLEFHDLKINIKLNLTFFVRKTWVGGRAEVCPTGVHSKVQVHVKSDLKDSLC
jgi:hypothetical protein